MPIHLRTYQYLGIGEFQISEKISACGRFPYNVYICLLEGVHTVGYDRSECVLLRSDRRFLLHCSKVAYALIDAII